MTLPTLLARLERDGWTKCQPPHSLHTMQSSDGNLMIDVDFDGSWELSAFTDSDVAGVATGRYQTVDEGDSLREIPEAIRCAERGEARLVEDDAVYEYAEQKGAGMREEGE